MIPLNHGFFLVFILFSLGISSLLIRGNLLFILISLEIMMNAVALSFVLIGCYWAQIDGQIMYILIITTSAAEVSVGLIFLMKLYKKYNTLNVDVLSEMRE